jgi:hypothetical protein
LNRTAAADWSVGVKTQTHERVRERAGKGRREIYSENDYAACLVYLLCDLEDLVRVEGRSESA